MPGENLTHVEAQSRAAVVQTSAYEIALDLTRGETLFGADTTIHFTARPGAETFIDCIADAVHSITLNGTSLDPATHFADSRIALPGLAAENTLTIVSDMRYMNTGEGLHRFVDPVDGEVYLYSQFEVPDSRRMYPVFEQPDLKATFQFTVTAPAYWKVVSVQPTPEPVAAGQVDGVEVATWHFTPTPIMSSYITAIVAGPYHEVRSELTNPDGRTIPLGVFCRESLAEHLDHDYIFDITRKGFDFFAKEFDYPYPFEKYDQLFVPEFNMGAMEHIGAVTFTEAYVFRSQVTDAMRERRVVTILHELAHMWFGNLVTMRWWNDLWLNESFAEYMSTLATAEATEWNEGWTTFVGSGKTWAYRQDQLPSTHPIMANIADLNDVLVNFDGITYAKGASVLKQLVAWVGREPFMKGVHDYFEKYAYSNTELPDLMRELEATSGRDLAEWTKAWLQTAGVNTLRPVFTTDAQGNFESFAIEQSATDDYPTIRPHRLAVGLYSLEGGKLVRTKRVELDVAGESTSVAELVGVAQPDLILLNDDDLTYAKTRFDERSLATVREHLATMPDSLARGLVWGSLWDTTRDAEMPASEFIEIVLANVHAETNSTILRNIINQLLTATHSYLAPEKREATRTRVADALWELANAAEAASDAQFQFIKAFSALAETPDETAKIQALLDGTVKLEGLTVDTDLTWEFVISLAAAGLVDGSAIDEVLATDLTASGKQFAAYAHAALPTAEAKESTWQQMVETEGAANLTIRFAALGFNRVHDTELLRPFIERFFASIDAVWNDRSYAIGEEIFEGFYPAPLADAQLQQATRAWLDANPDAAPALRRFMIEHLADVERALDAQARDAQA